MHPWINTTIFTLTLIVMLIGLVGVIIPIFPGVLVIWLAALGYGLLTSFEPPGLLIFIIITLALIPGVTVDNILMGAGARRGGASWVSILVALVAGIAGTLLFPPIGGLIAAPLAVLLLEFQRVRDMGKAWGATRGLAIGWLLSVGAKFIIGSLMIGLWLIWALS
ncbi:MAG: DUF456 domain-containing protein [Anaerolineales bacterium]